jgi:hypothetical protein
MSSAGPGPALRLYHSTREIERAARTNSPRFQSAEIL